MKFNFQDSDHDVIEFMPEHKTFKVRANGSRPAEYAPTANLYILRKNECARLAGIFSRRYPNLVYSKIIRIITKVLDFLEMFHSLTTPTVYRHLLWINELLSNECFVKATNEINEDVLKKLKDDMVIYEINNTRLLNHWRPLNEAFSVQQTEYFIKSPVVKAKENWSESERDVAKDVVNLFIRATIDEIPRVKEFYDKLSWITDRFGQINTIYAMCAASNVPPLNIEEIRQRLIYGLPLDTEVLDRFRLLYDICEELDKIHVSEEKFPRMLKNIATEISGWSFDFKIEGMEKLHMRAHARNVNKEDKKLIWALWALIGRPHYLFDHKLIKKSRLPLMWDNEMIVEYDGTVKLLGRKEANHQSYKISNDFLGTTLIKNHFIICASKRIDFYCPLNSFKLCRSNCNSCWIKNGSKSLRNFLEIKISPKLEAIISEDPQFDWLKRFC